MIEGRHIRFDVYGQNPKTTIWMVIAKDGEIILGKISWFGRWRGYAFFPNPEMVFEKTCLRDIADFIEDQNKQQRKKPKT